MTEMMRTAFMLPIEAMKAACDMQKRMLETMESFLPGVDAERRQGVAEDTQPPATAATVAASSAADQAPSAGGWGPVTPADPVTGWGPMPR